MAVKVGFIGTGGIAGAHLNALKTFEDVEFVAMCDVVEEKAEARDRQERYGHEEGVYDTSRQTPQRL